MLHDTHVVSHPEGVHIFVCHLVGDLQLAAYTNNKRLAIRLLFGKDLLFLRHVAYVYFLTPSFGPLE